MIVLFLEKKNLSQNKTQEVDESILFPNLLTSFLSCLRIHSGSHVVNDARDLLSKYLSHLFSEIQLYLNRRKTRNPVFLPLSTMVLNNSSR